MTDAEREELRMELAGYLTEMSSLFDRESRLTLIVRQPHKRDADMLVTVDEIPDVIKALERLHAHIALKTGRVRKSTAAEVAAATCPKCKRPSGRPSTDEGGFRMNCDECGVFWRPQEAELKPGDTVTVKQVNVENPPGLTDVGPAVMADDGCPNHDAHLGAVEVA